MKSKHKAWLPVTLVIALITSTIPSLFAATAQAASLSGPSPTNTTVKKEREELPKLRKQNSKTYENPNGSFTTEIYQDPIHFKDSTGNWVPIDNTLSTDSTTNTVVNKANNFHVHFGKDNTANDLVQVSKDQTSLSLTPSSQNDPIPSKFLTKKITGMGKIDKNEITFPNIYPDTDLQYQVGAQKVKEKVVIHKKPDATSPTQYSFKVNMKGLNYKQEPDGSLTFTDSKTGTPVYYIEKPFMYDSNIPAGFNSVKPDAIPEGSRSDDVQMNAVQRGNQLYIDVIPNQAWLMDAQRVYPVVIDPSIVTIQPVDNSGIDANIRSYTPTATGGADTELGAGLYQDTTKSNIIRSLLNFNLSSIPNDAYVLSADLSLWLSSYSSANPIDISAYQVTKKWTESGVTWNTTDGTTAWTNKGGDFNSTPLSTTTVTENTTQTNYFRWNLTDFIDKNRNSSNFGILLKSNSETTNIYKKFYSSDEPTATSYHPMLAVTYYSTARLGLEPYWTYDAHDVAGGKSYTNMTTGNNVVQATDVSLKGRGGMGINFTRTYNSKALDNTAMGYGWCFTGGDTIVERQAGATKALVTDADGTTHVFPIDPVTGTYSSPPGEYLSLTKILDATGQLTGYDLRDKFGNLTHFDYRFTTSEYNQDANTSYIGYIQDRHGNRITYNYDNNNNLTSITDPTGRQVTIAYGTNGKISSVTDFAGRKTVYGYDASGNLMTVDNYVDSTNYRRTQYNYDAGHNLTQVIDPKGRYTDFTYTNEALSKVQEPDVLAPTDGANRPGTTYSYDIPNYTSSLTDRNGHKTTYNCNSNYVVTKVSDALNRVTQYGLDSNYNKTQVTDPNGNVTNNTFDSSGNLISSLDPEGHTISFTYDAYSNPTSSTDALGKKTTSTYNGNGDLLSVTDPLGHVTSNTYDAYGNRTSTTDANGNKTSYGYDANGINQTSVTDAAGKTTTMAYDGADNVTTVSDPNGQVTNQQYNWQDEVTQMNQKASSSSTTSTYMLTPHYDANGNVQSIADGTTNKSTSYGYTGTNDISSQSTGSTQQIGYQYDANENVTAYSPISSLGHSLSFSYDAVDQLKQVKDATSQSVIEDNTYDANGNLTAAQRTGADGITQSKVYDKANRLSNMSVSKGTSTLFNFGYTRDANGRITSVTDNNGTTNYGYDNAGQLTNYSDANGITTYTYDNIGNRMSKTSPSGTTTYTYNALNQLISRSGAEGNASYQYNDNGELISKSGCTYGWDTDGNITKITKPDGSIVQYTYDSQGRRTEKTDKDGTGKTTRDLQYQYEDATNNIVAETDVLANTTITYSYDPNGTLISQTQGGKTYYYNYNGLGDVVALTDATGNVVVSYSYDPWGQTVNKTGTLYNPYTYRGYYQDDEAGLYYLINRYYDPEDGRFLSRDPDYPVNGNDYIYTDNDPVNKVDPEGDKALTRYSGYDWLFIAVGGLLGYMSGNLLPDYHITYSSGSDKTSSYKDITKPGSVKNRSTGVSKDTFEKNLIKRGWKRNVSKDGTTIILTKNGAKYSLRGKANSHTGWTADFYPSGSKKATLKIRLGG
ncbi:DNRLRE domain-containing protein [Aneurinibacillus sp. Ricciae_BoGa-3]|uniref:DNRLRE domain-containing protein n=1 Tax=Aneurinibacillus sp. Ricciae_BoGa-3 TaxID=3022697 RepID=UPI0023413B85|nr:DNRLRE domain-containing protein [Aneurinibacillus sp. Ricciae_BoGa-3]WCK55592.1 DNRLRE domain-containing protein [Aneurinibacillus sp. Ricciae_BoGa-3]